MEQDKKQRKLSGRQEAFINNLLKGMTKTDAYILAYDPERKLPRERAMSRGYTTFNRPTIKQAYEERLKEHRDKEEQVIAWTREQSIEALSFVVMANRKDIERIQQAAEEEEQMFQQTMISNPELAESIKAQSIKQRKKTRTNLVNNTGIISAVAELNKMQGFNEQNVNMNTAVVFTGDDQLLD